MPRPVDLLDLVTAIPTMERIGYSLTHSIMQCVIMIHELAEHY